MGHLRFAGLIGLEGAVRSHSRAVVKAINDAGVRVVMVTGANALTARAAALQVGIPPGARELSSVLRHLFRRWRR